MDRLGDGPVTRHRERSEVTAEVDRSGRPGDGDVSKTAILLTGVLVWAPFRFLFFCFVLIALSQLL